MAFYMLLHILAVFNLKVISIIYFKLLDRRVFFSTIIKNEFILTQNYNKMNVYETFRVNPYHVSQCAT